MTTITEEEIEYEYTAYGRDKNTIIVAGGGLMNGNAYANVELINKKWYYVEYGKNPKKYVIGTHIVFDDEGCDFNITNDDFDEIDEYFEL